MEQDTLQPHTLPETETQISETKTLRQMTTLTTGVYSLPPDCKAMVRDGKVIVTAKKKVIDRVPRCRECKHFALGQSKHSQRYPSPVCLMRPKENGNTGYPEGVRSQTRYYSTLDCNKACDKFEPSLK